MNKWDGWGWGGRAQAQISSTDKRQGYYQKMLKGHKCLPSLGTSNIKGKH